MEELAQVFDFFHSIHPLSPDLKMCLSEIIDEKTIERSEIVLKPGQTNKTIFFIKRGMLRAYYTKDTVDVSTWFMKEGDFCVSILSFYEQKPSFEYIQALEKTEVFYTTYDKLENAFQKFPEFNYIGRKLEIKYLLQSAWQLYSIRMQTAEERYKWLLAAHPDIIQRVPDKYIASYLGITPVTFSKMRSKAATKIKK